jgi:hypothetical protein
MNKFENVIILLTGIDGVGKRTIGEALCSLDRTFRLVLSDFWLNPVLQLMSDDPNVINTLDAKGWRAINEIRDVIFDTIAHVCPQGSNFIITEKLVEGNIWHKKFYERVELMANEKQALLVAVRLICELPVLLTRVVSEDRKKYHKPRDANVVRERVLLQETFKSKNKNELTLDTTDLSPKESAEKILHHLAIIV